MPTPTPTAIPRESPGTVLCDGAASGWDGWTAAPNWTYDGILRSAGTSSTSTLLTTPCNFKTTYYAIETTIQIARETPGSQLPCFHIDAQGFATQSDDL